MITISVKDFENYGIQKFSKTITFMGKTFIPGQTFSQRFRQQALELAEVNLSQNQPCLLIDYGTHVTLWQEKVLQPASLASGLHDVNDQQLISLALASNDNDNNNQHHFNSKYFTSKYQETVSSPGEPTQETIPEMDYLRSAPLLAKEQSQNGNCLSVEDEQHNDFSELQPPSQGDSQDSLDKKYQMQYRGRTIG